MKIAPTFIALLLSGCVSLETSELERMFEAHDGHRVQIAAVVVDLDSGERLYEREARRLLRPASTMKLLTTAAVCRRIVDGSVATTLARVGDRAVLDCGGDPFLGAEDVRVLAAQLVASRGDDAPIATVTVVDPLRDAPRFGQGWMWDDEPSSFMPPVSAAAVDGGCVTVEVAPGPGGGVRLLPVAGDLQLRVGSREGPLQVTRGRYREPRVIDVRGTHPGDEEATARRTVTAPEPARYTGHVLADALREAGATTASPQIEVLASSPTNAAAAAVLRRSIAKIVERTNRPSDNLGAELLLRHLAPSLDESSIAAGFAAIDEDLAALGLEPEAYRIADGSGVSHYTLIDAEVLARTLVDMHRRGGRSFEVFRDSLPVAGRDGTLRRRMRDTVAEGRVRAKTGTISGVSNLAGYVESVSGRSFAFVILVQNFVGPARPWRDLQDRFCAELAAL